MKAVQRGKFKTLVHPDGSPVTMDFEARIASAPQPSGGKTYARLSISEEIQSRLADVHATIKRHQPDVEYSPLLSNGTLVVKLGAKALVDHDLAVLDTVHVQMKLGSFGQFGYCWVASHLVRPM